MKKANQNTIAWEDDVSPKGKFAVTVKNLTRATGGPKDTGPWGGGHPFDVELVRVPPGKTNWPLHAHAAQWEAYIVVSGRGHARTESGSERIEAGDYVVHPPGEAHQFINDGSEDLVYYVIADNPRADVIYYPDSQKYFAKPQRKMFVREVDYFEGEE
ncbi:cupin domain-containing protein [Termitidicoccus mucosus]|uniref:Cupin type-2 domain-containing protein n=1 Tax=Termitidicoccus mucosus TaxID=1184151 RepID=A0A178IDD9_9BACT|nr:hypothetical protein AW736_21015 [Opitutaceae bacterium TSB47]